MAPPCVPGHNRTLHRRVLLREEAVRQGDDRDDQWCGPIVHLDDPGYCSGALRYRYFQSFPIGKILCGGEEGSVAWCPVEVLQRHYTEKSMMPVVDADAGEDFPSK